MQQPPTPAVAVATPAVAVDDRRWRTRAVATASGGGGNASGPSGDAGVGQRLRPCPVVPVSRSTLPCGQLGVSYRYATSNPGVSFDCSGLTHYAWGQAGVYLPRNSRAQAASTRAFLAASAQPGDLIFYYSPISHVGIYIGGGQMVHAPNSGTVVKIGSVNWGKVTAVSRPG